MGNAAGIGFGGVWGSSSLVLLSSVRIELLSSVTFVVGPTTDADVLQKKIENRTIDCLEYCNVWQRDVDNDAERQRTIRGI